jgi:hypothetical protein
MSGRSMCCFLVYVEAFYTVGGKSLTTSLESTGGSIESAGQFYFRLFPSAEVCHASDYQNAQLF